MADFTREEVIQVVEGGRKCVGADLRNIDLSGAGYNADTKWPDEDFDPVAKGAVNEPSGRSMNRWLANG